MSRLSVFWKGPYGFVLRLVLAILPLALLFSRVRPSMFWSNLVQIGLLAPALSLGVGLASLVISALRFRLLLLSLGAEPKACPSTLTAFRHLLIAGYYALLPSGLLGDADRGRRIAKSLPAPELAVAAVFLDRVLGLMGLALVVLVASILGSPVPPALNAFALIFSLSVLLSGTVLFALIAKHSQWLASRLRNFPLLNRAIPSFPSSGLPQRLLLLLLLAACTHCLAILSVVSLLYPQNHQISPIACAQVVPLIFLGLFVPITPAGLGQREALFSTLLGPVGISQPQAFSASIVYSSLAVFAALLGGFVLLVESVLARSKLPA